MVFLIWLLTAVMVFDCVALILLVLIQLPKKEAGAGLAFGGSATDALFGAGSGNVLTKITKYAAGIFFALAIILSWMQSYSHRQGSAGFLNRMTQASHGAAPANSTPAPGTAPAATPGSGTNSSLLTTPLSTTNASPLTAPAETTPATPAPGTAK
jgi:preprotein translocase subunit SecG